MDGAHLVLPCTQDASAGSNVDSFHNGAIEVATVQFDWGTPDPLCGCYQSVRPAGGGQPVASGISGGHSCMDD